MKKAIAVIVTVDTKEAEARYLSEFIGAAGFEAPVIDVSMLNASGFEAAYPREEVCRRGGVAAADLPKLRRDNMILTMGKGALDILLELHREGKLGGVLSVGGNQGTAIASVAMRGLPIGVPKLIISTVASGNVRPYVEYRDIMMMFSVADFLGADNMISRTILSNGAGAVMGMALHGLPLERGNRPVVVTTAFGNTDPAVSRARGLLEEKGYEVIAFHASGAGGSAMEYLIEQGYVQGVLDVTTHELLAEVNPEAQDIYTPLRPRLTEAARLGIPQVVVPGAIEYFCFGSPDSYAQRFKDRQTHYHNPYNTNVRADREELLKTAREMARRLNGSAGPVAVLLPLRGFSANGKEGGTLYCPELDRDFIDVLEKELDPKVQVVKLDANINDPAFADRAAGLMDEMIRAMKA